METLDFLESGLLNNVVVIFLNILAQSLWSPDRNKDLKNHHTKISQGLRYPGRQTHHFPVKIENLH